MLKPLLKQSCTSLFLPQHGTFLCCGLPLYLGSGRRPRQGQQGGWELRLGIGEGIWLNSCNCSSPATHCFLPSFPHLAHTKAASLPGNTACVSHSGCGNVCRDLLCVTDVNPKPYRRCYICFGFVHGTEGWGGWGTFHGQGPNDMSYFITFISYYRRLHSKKELVLTLEPPAFVKSLFSPSPAACCWSTVCAGGSELTEL